MTTPTDTFSALTASEERSEAERNRALFEQWSMPRPTVAQAVLRYWFLVLIPAVLLGGAGAALALKHRPTYTSEATLNVGRPDPSSPSFGGYVTAAAGLAAVYSREMGAPGVIGPVGEKLQLSPGLVASRLSATPIPDSPIIRIIAKAPSASSAEAIANTGAGALASYVAATNRQDPDASRLFGEYENLAGQKSQNDQQLAKDNQALNSEPGNSALRAKIALETAKSNVLGLRLSAVNDAYVSAEANQASTNIITPLSPATSTSSDRPSKVQKLAGAGVLAGLVIGVALAMWRANWVTRQRLLG
jgi:capsular polysaccharide biosynthesis protein